jgi:alpha-methylacyl-CoA racemase
MLAALWNTQRGGAGQIVDAAMVDGAAMLMTSLYGMLGSGMHTGPRGTNLLDSGAPHYEVFRCADGEYVSVAPIELKFRKVLRSSGAGRRLPGRPGRPHRWPAVRQRLATLPPVARAPVVRRAGAATPVRAGARPGEAAAHPHHQSARPSSRSAA